MVNQDPDGNSSSFNGQKTNSQVEPAMPTDPKDVRARDRLTRLTNCPQDLRCKSTTSTARHGKLREMCPTQKLSAPFHWEKQNQLPLEPLSNVELARTFLHRKNL